MSDSITPSIKAPQRASLCTPYLALGLLISAGSAAAQSDTAADAEVSTEAMLKDLQEQINTLTARLDKSPTIGSTRADMKLFGRIHLDAWTYPSSDEAIDVFETGDPDLGVQNRTLFRRARLGASGKIDDSMSYKFEIDFGLPSSFVFKDVSMAFHDLPGGQSLVIGNQKRPYGLDHLNSSRFNIFMERPYVVEALNQDARRLGVMAQGVSEDKAWNWRYGGFHMANIAASGRTIGDTFQGEFAARLANTAMWENDGRDYAHWAVSGSIAFPDGNTGPGDASNEGRFRTRPEGRTNSRWINTDRIDGVDSYQIGAVEGVWNNGPTNVTAEYMNTWVSRSDQNDLMFGGGYIQVAHFLTGEYMPWSRKSGTLGRPKPSKNFAPGIGSGAWQIAARYSFADFSNEEVRGGRGESITLGVNWYWNPNASVQFNYIRGEISERDEVANGNVFESGDYEVLGMRLRVDF